MLTENHELSLDSRMLELLYIQKPNTKWKMKAMLIHERTVDISDLSYLGGGESYGNAEKIQSIIN